MHHGNIASLNNATSNGETFNSAILKEWTWNSKYNAILKQN